MSELDAVENNILLAKMFTPAHNRTMQATNAKKRDDRLQRQVVCHLTISASPGLAARQTPLDGGWLSCFPSCCGVGTDLWFLPHFRAKERSIQEKERQNLRARVVSTQRRQSIASAAEDRGWKASVLGTWAAACVNADTLGRILGHIRLHLLEARNSTKV